ncbi:hypothetical protein SDC9_72111 [bioreactor metagenome]|uniref:Threonine/serine exporter-like N-terminal domain-containing protein n=1 Tax=bioreactor metagenome TaxID=1076179 RepID=A0A644YHN0_9ZZZZ
MDYNGLLGMVTEFGYRLQSGGAEIYRVEESVSRLLAAYGVDNPEVFAIPNCLIVSFSTPEGEAKTTMRRISYQSTNISLIEAYSDLCRRLCRQPVPIQEAWEAMERIEADAKHYPLRVRLLGYFIGTGGFSLFFGGTWQDAVAAGICGVAIGLCVSAMAGVKTNLFVKTLVTAFISALLAVILVELGVGQNPNFITIGALMALVPGIVFTNFMRDIMAGDMVAGLIKLTEALLIAAAIAVGTGVAMALVKMVGGIL